MKFALVAALSLATAAIASPARCIGKAQGHLLINKWVAMMKNDTSKGWGNTTAIADQIMAEDYWEFSGSVNSLIVDSGVPGATLTMNPTNAGRAANLVDLVQHPVAEINTLEVIVACNKIVWYWSMPTLAGPDSQVVWGINIFTVDPTAPQPITSSNFEFNSIAWGTNTHQLPPQCYPAKTG